MCTGHEWVGQSYSFDGIEYLNYARPLLQLLYSMRFLPVYKHGMQVAAAQVQAIPNMHELRLQFQTLQAKVDQSCQYKGDSHHFIGKDCYEMTTKGEVGGGIRVFSAYITPMRRSASVTP